MTMIDWVTALVPCSHPLPVNGGLVVSVSPDGAIEWQTHKHLSVSGSHESSIQVRTETVSGTGEGASLRIHGNPVKWFQGHNLFGSDDLVGLVAELMHALTPLLELTPTSDDIAMWWAGNWTITRIDVTQTFSLSSRADVRAWLRSAEHSAHMRHRGKGMFQNGTLYFGKHSRRWSLKCYSKGDECETPGHLLPSALQVPGLLSYADTALRVELVLRSMELKRRRLDLASNWGESDTLEAFNECLQGLQMSDVHTLPSAVLSDLPPRLVAVYHLWIEGHDLRAMYPKPTFYRYRSQLLEHGVDIAIKQPREDRSNVVPLVRVLEAKPASIPNWAYGTPLLFEPRRRIVG